MANLDMGSINPFANLSISSLGTMGAILLVFVIAIIILAMIGFIIYIRVIKKKYWINIEVSRTIGGTPQRVATFQAMEVPFGMAGDKLWKVSSGMLKLKAIKWLPVGTMQSAPRLFKYYIRSDGEWINYQDQNLDELSKTMGVRFVQEDMRLQRLATERLLEQRLMNKTFWEKWGTVVMTLVFFLVIAVCMVIIFYQFSKVQDKQAQIESVQLDISKLMLRIFGENYISETRNMTAGGNEGLVPAV